MQSTPRPFWRGHLRLALVSIPVRLVSAAASEEKIALHQVDRNSKKRIRYQKIAGEGGPPVAQQDIVQAFKLDDGTYALFERDELDALKLSSQHTIELVKFVDAGSIDPMYFDNPYYLLPDGNVAEEAYQVIRDALRQSGKYGIGQLSLRGRESLVVLLPRGRGMVVETLRYASEVRDPDAIFADIAVGKTRAELNDMAVRLIEDRSAAFDPSAFKDHYADALRDLVRRKQEGGETVDVSGERETEQRGATVVDFMDALRRSVERSGGTKSPATSPPKAPAARAIRAKAPQSAGPAAPVRAAAAVSTPRQPAKREGVKREGASAAKAKPKSKSR